MGGRSTLPLATEGFAEAGLAAFLDMPVAAEVDGLLETAAVETVDRLTLGARCV